MHVHFLTVGRTKSSECAGLFSYYTRLCSKFAKIETHALLPASSKSADVDYALSRWLEKNGARSFLTILDERGKLFTSQELSVKLETIQNGSFSRWIIAIGSEHGYGSALKTQAQMLWSLSPLTFPHELAAVIAAEQIFRGFSILHNHPYHNA